MKLGCHAVLFKEKIATQTEQVLSQIRETGFVGTEIGSRFFGTDKKEYLKQLLEQNQIEMSGMHAVVQLIDMVDNKETALNNIMKIVEFVKDMPNKNIIMTGLHKLPNETEVDARLKDEAFVKEVAIGLNLLAQKAGELGVKVHYHNHSWEFENDALIFHSIGKYAPDLLFGLDTGWAFSMGYDPVALMDEYIGRFHYVHLRDYNKDTKEFVNLGCGNQDYPKIMKKLQEILGPDDWAIVEYETGEEDYSRYSRAYEFLNRYI